MHSFTRLRANTRH